MAIRLALQGQGRDQIRNAIEQRFGYDLSETVDSLRSWYAFDVSCRGTVPPAIICALEATDFEDAIRNAVSIGGDTDTLACITGGIAEAMFGIPGWIAEEALARLDDDLRDVVERSERSISSLQHQGRIKGQDCRSGSWREPGPETRVPPRYPDERNAWET